MRIRLIWKILAVNLLVLLCVVVLTWWAVDILAADYFMTLMKKFNIDPQASHHMFLETVHRYLLWSLAVGLVLAAVLNLLLLRRVLHPLERMTRLAGRVAAGDYQVRAPVQGSDEVASLARAFNEMTVSLAHMENLRKKMVADVAHELRTPLTNMQGYLEGLREGVVEPGPATFALLHGEALRLNELVENLLSLARADAARANLHKEPLDYAALWGQLTETWAPLYRERGITLATQVDPAAGRLVADRGQLLQMLDNLLQNGLNYTPRDATCRVTVRREGDLVLTSFVNPAPELAPGDVGLLFERFFRGEKSRSREHGGSGIGLAIVQELAEAHGGGASAGLAGGSLTVTLSLPAEL